eukprot:403355221
MNFNYRGHINQFQPTNQNTFNQPAPGQSTLNFNAGGGQYFGNSQPQQNPPLQSNQFQQQPPPPHIYYFEADGFIKKYKFDHLTFSEKLTLLQLIEAFNQSLIDQEDLQQVMETLEFQRNPNNDRIIETRKLDIQKDMYLEQYDQFQESCLSTVRLHYKNEEVKSNERNVYGFLDEMFTNQVFHQTNKIRLQQGTDLLMNGQNFTLLKHCILVVTDPTRVDRNLCVALESMS